MRIIRKTYDEFTVFESLCHKWFKMIHSDGTNFCKTVRVCSILNLIVKVYSLYDASSIIITYKNVTINSSNI